MKQHAFLKRIKKKNHSKIDSKSDSRLHSKINSRLHSMFYNMPRNLHETHDYVFYARDAFNMGYQHGVKLWIVISGVVCFQKLTDTQRWVGDGGHHGSRKILFTNHISREVNHDDSHFLKNMKPNVNC